MGFPLAKAPVRGMPSAHAGLRFGSDEPDGYYQRFINNMNLTFLATAIRERRMDEVDRMLAGEIDLNPTGEGDTDVLRTAIAVVRYASGLGLAPDITMIAKLLRAGADPNLKGRNSLQTVAEGVTSDAGWEEWPEALVLFLEHPGIQVDKQDDLGETALMAAVRMGHVNTVRKLLAAGANPHIQNSFNQTARDALVLLQQTMGGTLSRAAQFDVLFPRGFREDHIFQFPRFKPERWSLLERLLLEAEQTVLR